MKKTIIGISGKKRSGKDTAAQFLQSQLKHKFRQDAKIMCFAEGLKRVAAMALGEDLDLFFDDESKKRLFVVGPEHVMSGRSILQKVGTECFRDNIDLDFWVTMFMKHVKTAKEPYIIVPDTRFPNEFKAIKDIGGCVIRVDRDTADSTDTHISETALDNYVFDYRINNNGKLFDEAFTTDLDMVIAVVMAASRGNENSSK